MTKKTWLNLSSVVAVLAIITVFLPSIALTAVQTSSISGTIRDPAGALVAGARITAVSEIGESYSATSNDLGRFTIERVRPGRYRVTVESPGFRRFEVSTDVSSARGAVVEARLEIAAPEVEMTVRSKSGISGNTDPGYRGIRDPEFFESYSVSNLTVKRDVGTLTLHNGIISFASPTMQRVVKAVFIGDGQFSLTPAIRVERDYLRFLTEKDVVEERFERLVICFTDNTYEMVKENGKKVDVDPNASGVMKDFQDRVRNRNERPRSLVEALVETQGENLDAELLLDVYNARRGGSFNAFIFGKTYKDLRFLVRPRGALPQILSPEEVALINVDPQAEREGIWYLAHYLHEYKNGVASSLEDKRVVDAQHYKIETVIGKDEKLTAVAQVTVAALGEGDRIIRMGLLPNLRVSRVAFEDQDLHFIQEERKRDGSFYVVMPAPMTRGKRYTLIVEYRGDRVVEDVGGGNFAVGARTSWYPNVNNFADRATFDLTFRIPRQYTLVGIGKLISETRDGDYAVSEWSSKVPLAVAGFNFGEFKKKELIDADTSIAIEGYATRDVPAALRGAENRVNLSPARMTEVAMVDAQNSVRIFSHWFGASPYGRLAVTQQPQSAFGQSWPTLVYLPLVAFFDSTQRYMLMGGINSRLTDFIQEVTPHEVAHQWWGHMVGWASYHDQWLSEGFADFSAGLYLQAIEKDPNRYLNFWKRNREQILEKNAFGKRANDAGPIWMGLRLNTFKTRFAYNNLVYPKGGFVLHMLRSLMWDRESGDKKFIAMMHDFVSSHLHKSASTESFKRTVEKHMTPAMDLDGNKRMDWFFDSWVYGTEVPSYKLSYSLKPEDGGKVLMTATITQSGVSPQFKMLVPVYADFDGRIMRLGDANLTGSTTTQEFKLRLPKKPRNIMINHYYDVLAHSSVSEQIK